MTRRGILPQTRATEALREAHERPQRARFQDVLDHATDLEVFDLYCSHAQPDYFGAFTTMQLWKRDAARAELSHRLIIVKDERTGRCIS